MELFTHDLYVLYVFRSDVGQLKPSVFSTDELNVLLKIGFKTIDYDFLMYVRIRYDRD